MRRKLLVLSISLIFLTSFSVIVFAHAGGTDGAGGHYQGANYHYHHGYPAHQHTDGKCPYDFKDNVDHNKNNSGNSSIVTTTFPEIVIPTFSDSFNVPEVTEDYTYKSYETSDAQIDFGVAAVILCFVAAVSTLLLIKKSDKYEQLQSDYNELDLEVFRLKKEVKKNAEELNKTTFNQIEEKNYTNEVQIDYQNLKREYDIIKNNYEIYKSDVLKKDVEFTNSLAEFNLALVKRFGNDYLYKISNAPKGHRINNNGFPYEPLKDTYSFFINRTNDRNPLKYHTRFCHHASFANEINAYTMQKSKEYEYIPCQVCNPGKLPNTEWVDKYLRYYKFLVDIIPEDTDNYLLNPTSKTERPKNNSLQYNSLPHRIDNKVLKYSYTSVVELFSENDYWLPYIEDNEVHFQQEPDNDEDSRSVALYYYDIKIGYVPYNQVRGMINSYIEKGDTIFAYLYDENKIKVGFYLPDNSNHN